MSASSPLKLPPRNVLAVLHDVVLGAASFMLALWLRLGEQTLSFSGSYMWHGALGFSVLLLITLLYYRSYRRVWLYTSLNDLTALAKAGTIALLAFYVGMFVMNRLEGLPRSIPFIHWMCLMLCLAAPRVLWRMAHDRALLRRLIKGGYARVPVLLVGAGPQAEIFIRESERRVNFPYFVVGLVDDDARQHGREIHHVRIYGYIRETDFILRKLKRKGRTPHRLLIADPNLKPSSYQELLAVAAEHRLSLSRLPSLTELKAGEHMQDVHPIAVEDILGRPQVNLDRALMQRFVEGRRVMVTGAGGSIGAELVRQLAQYGPKELLLYELNESNLYYIDHELKEQGVTVARQAVIGDVRDKEQLERAFTHFKPEIVFHAAAIKHVPLAEANPEIAVMTNIWGSKLVADQCAKHGVKAMVQISTDKAVNPASVMGASKRVAELYTASLAGNGTHFVTVRFGNVLNSAGSVMPLFQKQIASGGPITITHKDMERYFMTIAEAVQLVLQAAAIGAEGPQASPIFVLDMGVPVKIEELACQMIRLAGLKPYEDIKITYTGARPGEKMSEQLFHDHEDRVGTGHAGIHLASSRTSDDQTLCQGMEAVIEAAKAGNGKAIPLLLKQIVTEYQLPTRNKETA